MLTFFRLPNSRVLGIGALLSVAAPFGMIGDVHAAKAPAQETIVFLRHGEKPEAGLGQLNCKGLNRSLALPAVLASRFGKPDAIFAPDPARQKEDSGTLYDYVRPLATIEPTAIAAGLPVATAFGYDEIGKLQTALSLPRYRMSLIFVAWEHKQIYTLAGKLLEDNGGDPKTMPKKWKGEDFDSLYVVRIDRSGAAPTATFEVKAEGLDNVAESCPKP
jgi:hypothetical protein